MQNQNQFIHFCCGIWSRLIRFSALRDLRVKKESILKMSLACTICSEVYKNSDDIYSTSCGHVFHFTCMQQWKSRSTSCPQCREHNPQSHKIYLTFDDAAETEQKILELKSQLEQSILNGSELQHQLEQTERNFLSVQLELSKSEETAKELSEQLSYLAIQNESREEAEKDTSTATENPEIKLKKPNAEIQLREKNKILEKKLKQISLELEKEIKNSTALTVDKMKLQSLLQQFATGGLNRQSSSNLLQVNKPQQNANDIKLMTERDRTIKSVVVKGLSEHAMKQPLKLVVLKLGALMCLHLTEDDIESACVLERKYLIRHNIQVERPAVVVNFKTLDHKIKFLSNKDKLKNNPQTRDIILYEFVTDETNSLYHYAKTTLKNTNYKFIFTRNNVVLIKKTKSDAPIRITNKQQVDDMLKGSNVGHTEYDLLDQTCDSSFYDIDFC